MDSSFRVIVHGEFPGGFLKSPCNHNPGIIGDHVGNLLNKNAIWTYFGTGSWGKETDPCWNPTSWDLHRVTLNAGTLLSYSLPTSTPTPTNTPTPTPTPTSTPTPIPTNTPTPKPTNTPTPRMTNTPTPKPTVSQCGSVPGDVNKDGKVNVLDIIKVVSVYNTQPPGDPCADLNSDGKVNVLDIIKVISYY